MNGNEQDTDHKSLDGFGAEFGDDDLESSAEKIIKSVSDELRPDAIRLITYAKRGFSGPTPPPAMLEEYERLVPGSAERFLDDYFQQKSAEADHRRGLQNKQLEYNLDIQQMNFDTDIRWIETMAQTRKRGQSFALVIAAVIALIAGYALYLNQTIAAVAIVSTGIGSSIAAMLLGHRKGKQDPEKADQ